MTSSLDQYGWLSKFALGSENSLEGCERVSQWLVEWIKDYQKDFDSDVRQTVSVGSGIAFFEYALGKLCPNLNIVCIDPIKAPDAMVPIQYASTDEYLASSSVAPCDLLVLCWPLPNESTYDIEAVKKLDPKLIFISYEDGGGACGRQFHSWLGTCVRGMYDCPEKGVCPEEPTNPKHTYTVVDKIEAKRAPFGSRFKLTYTSLLLKKL